jgi:hypothetical protein
LSIPPWTHPEGSWLEQSLSERMVRFLANEPLAASAAEELTN